MYGLARQIGQNTPAYDGKSCKVLDETVATCSKCKQENDRPWQRYCRSCHNAYMRANRPSYSQLTDEQKKRGNVRATANIYQARGKLNKEPCGTCGSSEHVEKHHSDYSKPLDVVWLCRTCHKTLHAA